VLTRTDARNGRTPEPSRECQDLEISWLWNPLTLLPAARAVAIVPSWRQPVPTAKRLSTLGWFAVGQCPRSHPRLDGVHSRSTRNSQPGAHEHKDRFRTG